MAVDKIKRTKAIGALRKVGMSHENAVRHVRYIDLDESFGPQIEELREDFPDLFAASDTDDTDTDERPMTRAEAIASRLRGEHIEGMTYRSKARRGPVTTSKSARTAADHLQSNHKESPPPVQQYREPVRDINAGHKPLTREPSAEAKSLAARLQGR